MNWTSHLNVYEKNYIKKKQSIFKLNFDLQKTFQIIGGSNAG